MRLYKCGAAAAAAAAAFMDVKGYYLLMLLPFTAIIQQTGNCFYFGVWSRQTDTNPKLSQLQRVSLGVFHGHSDSSSRACCSVNHFVSVEGAAP